MPASTGLCNAVIHTPANKWSNASSTKGLLRPHCESMACRPSCVADRHRRQREFLGAVMETVSAAYCRDTAAEHSGITDSSPGEHLVPIQADLSDLEEQLDWCSSHPKNVQTSQQQAGLAEQVVEEIEDDLVRAGCFLRTGMDVSRSWTAHDWLNRGGELLDADPLACKTRLRREVCKSTPLKRLAGSTWDRPAPAVPHCCSGSRVSQCLALLTARKRNRQHATTWLRICYYLAWQKGWNHYAQRFDRKPGNHPFFTAPSDPTIRGPLKPGSACVVDE